MNLAMQLSKLTIMVNSYNDSKILNKTMSSENRAIIEIKESFPKKNMLKKYNI